MGNLTQKQINVLKVLAKGEPVVATWSHSELSALLNYKFANRQTAFQASGKLSSNLIWTISAAGRAFLESEREGL